MTTYQPSSPKRNGRATKSQAVVRRLRQQIVNGLKPEERLLTFAEMEEAFGVSRAVVREAVDQLKRDGFIYSVDRRGLYVSDRPPHLSRFGLVFPNNPSSPDWPRFFTALQHEAAGLQQEEGEISFPNYYDVAPGAKAESFSRLKRDVQAHRLAGLLLMPGSHGLGQVEPFTDPSLPKVYICGSPEVGRVPSVATDERQMCVRMVQWLEDQGRTRLAVVAMCENAAERLRLLAEHGVPHRPHWAQTLGRENQADVRRVVALLMDYPAKERPDGLIILDDNLTEHAVGGLLDANLKIGRDIDVIAHCNWPWPVASAAPIQRVGFHGRHVLKLAMRAVELLREGQHLSSDFVVVPALFEEEVTRSWQPVAFESPVKE